MTMLRAAFVPMEWVFSGLSGEALRTLILISSYADRSTGECWPSNRQLANVLGKSERQVRRAISEIEKEGLLFVDQGDGKNRKFRIVSEEWFAKSAPKRSLNPDTKRPSCDPETRTENDRDEAPQPGHKVTGMNGATRTQSDRQPGHFMTGNPDTKRPGPNKKDIQEHIQEGERESGSVPEESKPDFAGDVTAALALADLGRAPEPIPADILRMATAVGAENWIGQVRFQEIPFDDWRVRETLTVIQARGGNKGPNYAWAIFRGLPEKKPAAPTNGHANGKPANAEPRELVNARNALSMAERLLPKGESTPEEVERYRNKVETLARKAGIA